MATVRGMDGSLHVGGVILTTDSLIVDADVTGTGSEDTVMLTAPSGKMVKGVILVGDTFTVGASSTVYTVAGTAPGNFDIDDTERISVEFTPALTSGTDFAEDAEVTFAAHSVAQVRSWSASVSRERLDASYMGLASKQYRLGQYDWTGASEVLLDYDDTEQALLIDRLLANSDTSVTLTLRADTGKQFYGNMFVSGGDVTDEVSALVTISFEFQGTSPLAIDWT